MRRPANESRENFDALLDQHIQRFSPIDGVELGVIEEMAAAFWRMRRAWAVETRLHGDEIGRITAAFTDLAPAPHLGLLHRYEARLTCHPRNGRFQRLVRSWEYPGNSGGAR